MMKSPGADPANGRPGGRDGPRGLNEDRAPPGSMTSDIYTVTTVGRDVRYTIRMTPSGTLIGS